MHNKSSYAQALRFCSRRVYFFEIVAEREGFEPSIRFTVYTLSRRAPSTARTPLRIRAQSLNQGEELFKCKQLKVAEREGLIRLLCRLTLRAARFACCPKSRCDFVEPFFRVLILMFPHSIPKK